MRPWQIKKIILLSRVEAFEQGEDVIREGEHSEEFFVILEGSADARVTGSDGESVSLRKMETGEVFGEIALVSKVPRTADVVANENLRVLAMDWDSVKRVSGVYPRISSKLFRNLASILGDRLAENTPGYEERS